MIKFIIILALGAFLALSFVHQTQTPVDPSCDLDSSGPLCTSSGVSYKLYWDPIWNPSQ